MKVTRIRCGRGKPEAMKGRWATPSWGDWKRKRGARSGWMYVTYVRSACTFEVHFIPKARKPKRPSGAHEYVPGDYPRCYFPSAELWRMHHNGCEDLLVRLWTYACPPTKEEAFDVLTELGHRLGVWV